MSSLWLLIPLYFGRGGVSRGEEEAKQMSQLCVPNPTCVEVVLWLLLSLSDNVVQGRYGGIEDGDERLRYIRYTVTITSSRRFMCIVPQFRVN